MLRSTGGNISPSTEKQRGGSAPAPSRYTVVAAIKKMKFGLMAVRIVPTRKKIIEIISMILRPYMSENLPKMSVTKAAARAGMEMLQEIRDIPSRSAAIRGLAMAIGWM